MMEDGRRLSSIKNAIHSHVDQIADELSVDHLRWILLTIAIRLEAIARLEAITIRDHFAHVNICMCFPFEPLRLWMAVSWMALLSCSFMKAWQVFAPPFFCKILDM